MSNHRYPTHTPRDVTTVLSHELAHLWPSIKALNGLQTLCAQTLPQLFIYCQVLSYERSKLTIAVPHAALASKLKQQLPKLQLALQEKGWQINDIRLKIMAHQAPIAPVNKPHRLLPQTALDAFTQLSEHLKHSGADEDLLAALHHLLTQH